MSSPWASGASTWQPEQFARLDLPRIGLVPGAAGLFRSTPTPQWAALPFVAVLNLHSGATLDLPRPHPRARRYQPINWAAFASQPAALFLPAVLDLDRGAGCSGKPRSAKARSLARHVASWTTRTAPAKFVPGRQARSGQPAGRPVHPGADYVRPARSVKI